MHIFSVSTCNRRAPLWIGGFYDSENHSKDKNAINTCVIFLENCLNYENIIFERFKIKFPLATSVLSIMSQIKNKINI